MARQSTATKKKKFIEAFNATMGNISMSCQKIGISRRTFYNWLNNDDKFREEIEDLTEKNIDYAESQLLKTIKEGNVTSLIFYLKTKGRNRGYVEKQDFDHRIVKEFENKSIEELKELAKMNPNDEE